MFFHRILAHAPREGIRKTMIRRLSLTAVAVHCLAFAPTSLAEDGKTLFDALCVSCHKTAGPPETAPPIFAVIHHVKAVYPDKEGFVDQVVEWVKAPNPDLALMPGAVRRFGLMPQLPIAESDVRKIAEYLYDYEVNLPPWYIQHYKQQHGVAPSTGVDGTER